MRDTRVEEEFARFAESAAGTFRPLPVDALPLRSRRGRLRVWLAGVAVAVLAAGGGVALRTAGPDTPAPTGFSVVQRPVVLAGADGPNQVRFADRQHGWVFFRNCDAQGGCAPRLGSTDDGGRTWRPRPLPDLPIYSDTNPLPYLLVFDAERVALYDLATAYWSTVDAGDTWTREDVTAHPEVPFPSVSSDPFTTAGDRLMLDGLGDVGVVPARPGTEIRTVVRTAGGSLWALLGRGSMAGPTLLVYSADGTSWQDVREESGYMYLLASPDRGDVWYVGAGEDRRLELLSAGRVIEQPAPPPLENLSGIAPIGGGRLLVTTPRQGLLLWSAGVTEPIPLPLNGRLTIVQLPDRTVMIFDAQSLTGPVSVGTVGGGWVQYS